MEKHLKPMHIPRIISKTAKILEKINPQLAAHFAMKLFTTPRRFKTPEREKKMLNGAIKEAVLIPKLNTKIQTYTYGSGFKKALLVHGWSGRGTQMAKIAQLLVENNFQVISFDAPGHGFSKGRKTNMVEFIACVSFLTKKYKGFDIAIGHSLGGMTLFNNIQQGDSIKKIISISAGNSVVEIFDRYIQKMKLQPNISKLMQYQFDRKYQFDVESLSVYQSITPQTQSIPVLIIHDKDDVEVFVHCGQQISALLPNAIYYETTLLGHRKILGDSSVLEKISTFIKN